MCEFVARVRVCHISQFKCDKTNGRCVCCWITIAPLYTIHYTIYEILENIFSSFPIFKSLKFIRYDWDDIATTAVMITTTFQINIPICSTTSVAPTHQRISNPFWAHTSIIRCSMCYSMLSSSGFSIFIHIYLYEKTSPNVPSSIFLFTVFFFIFVRYVNISISYPFNLFCSTQFHFLFLFYPI